jgi:hypothetical protein
MSECHAAPLLGCIRMFTGRQPLALVVEGTGDSKHPAWALALPGMLPGHAPSVRAATALLLASAEKLGRTHDTAQPAFSGLTGSGVDPGGRIK